MPSEPPRTARQDHAALAWLVIEAELPNAVHVHLVDALLNWAPLMGEHLFPTEPEPGVDAELRQVLEGMWWRLDAQAADARWADKVVLNEAWTGSPWHCRRYGHCAHQPVACRSLGYREGEAPRAA